MPVTTAIAVYFLIWWLVLFAVLPMGRAQPAGAGRHQPGHRSGRAGHSAGYGKARVDDARRHGIFTLCYVVYVIPAGDARRLGCFAWCAEIKKGRAEALPEFAVPLCAVSAAVCLARGIFSSPDLDPQRWRGELAALRYAERLDDTTAVVTCPGVALGTGLPGEWRRVLCFRG